MSAATSADLARLGVPFFALDPTLIVINDEQEKKEEVGGEHRGKISRKEAEALKVRMLTLLHDLCAE